LDITGYEIVKYIENKNKKLTSDEIKKKWDLESDFEYDFDDVQLINNITAKKYLKMQNKARFYIDEYDYQAPNPYLTLDQKTELKKYFIHNMFLDKKNLKKYLFGEKYDKLNIKEKININKKYKKKINDCCQDIKKVKCVLFEKEYMLDGINDIIDEKSCVNMVIDNHFKINNYKLTIHDKQKINKYYDIGDITKTSDKIIKKKILRTHFKKDIIDVDKKTRLLKIKNEVQTDYFDNVLKYHKEYTKILKAII
jgi:hypothetical protein